MVRRVRSRPDHHVCSSNPGWGDGGCRAAKGGAARENPADEFFVVNKRPTRESSLSDGPPFPWIYFLVNAELLSGPPRPGHADHRREKKKKPSPPEDPRLGRELLRWPDRARTAIKEPAKKVRSAEPHSASKQGANKTGTTCGPVSLIVGQLPDDVCSGNARSG